MPSTRSLGLVIAFALAACGDNIVGEPPEGWHSRMVTPPMPTDGGMVVNAYPEGPYGTGEGDIMQPGTFSGYFNTSADDGLAVEKTYRNDITLQEIRQLEGFTHALIVVGAEWCKPCREEAEALPGFYKDKWSSKGGYLLGILTQDRNFGPANQGVIEDWGEKYHTNYTLVHDPTDYISSVFAPPTVPFNVVVDLKTMKILRSKVGEDPSIFRFFEEQLEGR